MTDLNETELAKLAREMAMNIRNYKKVFADFNITEEDYYEICKIDFFKRAKDQYVIEWNSALSTADRVRILSAAGAEATLPTICKRMLDPNEPLASVIDGGKYLTKNAGIGDAKASPGNNERFIIQINLGADENGKEIVEIYDKSVLPDAGDNNGREMDAESRQENGAERHQRSLAPLTGSTRRRENPGR